MTRKLPDALWVEEEAGLTPLILHQHSIQAIVFGEMRGIGQIVDFSSLQRTREGYSAPETSVFAWSASWSWRMEVDWPPG